MTNKYLDELMALLEKITQEALRTHYGKTCIPITLDKEYGVRDGREIKVSNGHVFFTRNRNNLLECNFYPEYSRMRAIREANGENFGDMLEHVRPLHASHFKSRQHEDRAYRNSRLNQTPVRVYRSPRRFTFD